MKDRVTIDVEPSNLALFLIVFYFAIFVYLFIIGVTTPLEKIEKHLAVIATCSAPPTPEPPDEPEP